MANMEEEYVEGEEFDEEDEDGFEYEEDEDGDVEEGTELLLLFYREFALVHWLDHDVQTET